MLPVVVALAGGGGYGATLMSVWEVLPEEVANGGESHVRELSEQGVKSFQAYLGNFAETLANRGRGAPHLGQLHIIYDLALQGVAP